MLRISWCACNMLTIQFINCGGLNLAVFQQFRHILTRHYFVPATILPVIIKRTKVDGIALIEILQKFHFRPMSTVKSHVKIKPVSIYELYPNVSKYVSKYVAEYVAR